MTNAGPPTSTPPPPPPPTTWGGPPPPPQYGGGAPPAGEAPYPARLAVAYPEQLSRVTTAFRIILIIPIAILYGILSGGGTQSFQTDAGDWIYVTSAGIGGSLFFATLLMILFRERYPKWWFDFALELTRFGTRVGVYMALLTDQYPSTVEHQGVTLDVDYPDVERELSRGMPLVKWFLAIPHYIVLIFLSISAFFAVIIAWFAIIFTGRYPRGLFDYVVGVGRWGLRVNAYAFLLVTDRYPPFSLK
jgi:hypothetical protein